MSPFRESNNMPAVFCKKVKVWFYIALYPVRWTAQSALHFPPLADLFIPTRFSASLGSILAMQELRNDYSLTFPANDEAETVFLLNMLYRIVGSTCLTPLLCPGRGYEPLFQIRQAQS